MKKLVMGLLCLVCSLVFLYAQISILVGAKEVQETWTISSDTVIDGENTEFSQIDANAPIKICDSATVEFKNLTINVALDMSTLFNVDTGSKLILDNVNIASVQKLESIITNNGKLDINNTQFPKVASTYSIINNSSDAEAITLHYVGEKQIKNIYLNAGSVYVTEDTHFEDDSDYIEIQVTDSYDNLTVDTHMGRAVVKGKNTFAGYYLNNFKLVGAPFEPGISPTDNDAWSNFSDKFYLDYVGLIGDDLSDENSKFQTFYYNKSNKEETKLDYVKSGDIIITKPIVYLSDDGNRIVGGKFSTSRLFQKYNNDETYCVSAKVVENCDMSTQNKCLVLDNATSLIGNLKNDAITRRSSVLTKSDVVKLNILDTSTNQTTTKDISVVASQTVYDETSQSDITYQSNHIEFVNTYGYSVDSITSSGLNTNDSDLVLLQTGEFVLLKLTMLTSVENAQINVALSPLVQEPVQKSVYFDSTTFEYNKTNHLESLTPYILDDEGNKVYLEVSEYKLLDKDGQEISDITNAGSYQVVVNSTNENIIFVDNQFEVCVSKKLVSVEFDSTFIYDGNEHTAQVKNISGVLEGDTISTSDFVIQDPQTIPGQYTQIVALNLKNYDLFETYKKVTLEIKKYVVDICDVSLSSATFTYDPNVTYSLAIDGLKDEYKDIVTVEYTGNGKTEVLYDSNGNITSYTVLADFLVDENLYELKNSYQRRATLTIIQQFVDISCVSFPNVTIEYDGLEHSVQASNIPSQISQVRYLNNTPKKDTGKYYITANFSLDDTKNYTLSKNGTTYNSLSCSLTITQKVITDEYVYQVIDFQGKVVKYDGQFHSLNLILKDSSLINVTKFTGAYSEIGSYEYSTIVTVKDSKNYVLENNKSKIEITRILRIEQGDANFDGITFEDKTVVYSGLKNQIFTDNMPIYCEATYEYFQNDISLGTDGVIDVGEYLVKAYIVLTEQMSKNYNEKSETLCATLTIQKLVVDCSDISVSDYSCIYDGQPHNIVLKDNSIQIEFEYSQKDLVNVGTYPITLTAKPNKNFEYTNLIELKATLRIFKANYDMSGVKFSNILAEYDGTPKVALVSGTLPNGVYVLSYENNTHTHVSQSSSKTEVATVHFGTSDDNYNTPSDMTCQIKITPRNVSVVLKQSEFVYTGNEIVVEGSVVGKIGSDIVDVELSNNKNINAGSYYAMPTLNNPDYTCSNLSLVYKINKAKIDTNDFEFDDIRATYDGLEHQPTFKGVLPVGVYANLVAGKIVNVGTHTAYVEFKSSNQNYILPDNMIAHIEILPKPILLEFSNYTNLVEDGQVHPVTIKFFGTIESDFDDFVATYSDSPIKAGTYTVTVSLNQNSNYTILSGNTLTYEILTNNKTFVGGGKVISVKGSGFSSSSNLSASTIDISEFDQVIQENSSIKKYDAFKLEIDGIESSQEIDVTYKTGTLNLNSKYIRVYTITNGFVREVEFETAKNQITFSANIDDSIIIVEQKSSVEMTSIYIYLIVSLSVVSLLVMTPIICKNIKSKKKVKYFVDTIHN